MRPERIPLFPLNVVLLPGADLPLHIFEPRYLEMFDDAMKADRLIGVIQPALDQDNSDMAGTLEKVGCLGRITQIAETGDGRYMVVLTGIARFSVVREIPSQGAYRRCEVDFSQFGRDLAEDDAALADRGAIEAALREFASARNLGIDWDEIGKAPTGALVNALAMTCPFEPADKQALLEAIDVEARARAFVAFANLRGTGEGVGKATLH